MNVKVIATCFTTKEKRPQADFPAHPQNINSSVESLDMLRNTLKLEDRYNPGVGMDLIIVNSDSGFVEGNEFIKSINGQKTKWGKIIAYTRPNIGWSFGAFNDAFLLYRSDYKYWLFTEDDIFVGSPDYYKKLVDRWEELENIKVPIGYLALLKVVKHHYGVHCGGGIGFTSRAVLDKVIERNKTLPHYDQENNNKISLQKNRQQVILEGEVKFTNIIDDMGFILLDYGKNDSWNLYENLCYPYYLAKNEL